jgi:hypothetical protein
LDVGKGECEKENPKSLVVLAEEKFIKIQKV